MFQETIQRPVNPVTEEYLATIMKPINEPDLSLTLLGLACLKPRVKDYRGICGEVYSFATKELAFAEFLSKSDPAEDEIRFYYYMYNSDTVSQQHVETLIRKGFKHKDTVELIVKKQFDNIDYDVFYSTTSNSVVVFTTRRQKDLYHLTLSFLPLYYPNLFKEPLKRTDPEVIVLSSLSRQSARYFKSAVSEVLSQYAEEFYRAQISGLLKFHHQQKLAEAKDKVERTKRNMKQLLERYSEAVSLFREAVTFMEGAKVVEETSEWEEELVDFLSKSKLIRNVHINGSRIVFTVATVLHQFSTDTWNIFSRNGGIYSGLYGDYSGVGVFADRVNRKLLFDAIFCEDAKFQVKIAGNYIIDVRNNYFDTSPGFDYVYEDPIYEHYLPNPHLKIFGCLGQYERRVIEALDNGDVLTAFELCVHSAGSVDLDETEQTFRPFLGWIMKSDKKILRRYDGVEMTPGEALVWLIDSKENKE